VFDLAILPDQKITYMFVPGHCYTQSLTDVLKGMAKHSMTHIVNECSRQSNLGLMVSKVQSSNLYVTFNDSHQMTRRMEDTDAVSKSTMCRAGIYKFGKSKLLYPTETLKSASLDHLPDHVLELISSKLDKVVKWISYPLRSRSVSPQRQNTSGRT